MEFKKEPASWITVKGNHIPIMKGQSKKDAISSFLKEKSPEIKKNPSLYSGAGSEKDSFTHVTKHPFINISLFSKLSDCGRIDKNSILYKLTRYSLINQDKAETFKSALGYTTKNAQSLLDNIYQHVDQFDAIKCDQTEFGEKYKVEMYITGENNKKARVITIWMKYNNTDELIMANAYIKKWRKKDEI